MRDNIYIRSYVSFIPEKRISVDEIFAQLSDDATDGSSLTRFKADSHTESVAVFDTDPELGTALLPVKRWKKQIRLPRIYPISSSATSISRTPISVPLYILSGAS